MDITSLDRERFCQVKAISLQSFVSSYGISSSQLKVFLDSGEDDEYIINVFKI